MKGVIEMRRKILTAILIIATAISCLLIPLPAYASQGTDIVIPVNVPYVDNLNSQDEVDVFRFSITEPGSLQVRFEFHIEGKYDVEIFLITTDKGLVSLQRMSYSTYAQSVTGRYIDEGYKIRVPKGDYCVKVRRTDFGNYSSENYILTVKYTAEPGNDYEKEFNNEAKNATLISTNAPCTGNLSDSDDIDYYYVKLPAPGSLQIKFEYYPSGEYSVEVFELDSLNNLSSIQKSDFYSSSATVTGMYTQLGNKLRVPAGDYYIKVSRPALRDYCNDDYVLTILSDAKFATPPDTRIVANPNKSTVLVNGEKIAFDSYNIDGYNYFKLRDLAQAVNGTNKNFEVTWDGKRNAIFLYSNRPYTPVGNELKTSDRLTSKTVNPTTSLIYVDGKVVTLTAYNIDGSNYFKLRDIAKLFDIGVTWNGNTKTIEINTYMPYVE